MVTIVTGSQRRRDAVGTRSRDHGRNVYELVIRCDDDGVVIEPRGRLDKEADRHIGECLAAARDTGLTPRVSTGRPWPNVPRRPS